MKVSFWHFDKIIFNSGKRGREDDGRIGRQRREGEVREAEGKREVRGRREVKEAKGMKAVRREVVQPLCILCFILTVLWAKQEAGYEI